MMIGGCDRIVEGLRIDSMVAVAENPALIGDAKPGYGKYIQIDLSAPRQWVSAVNKGDGVYSEVGYCPLNPNSKLVAIGPYATNGRQLYSGSDWHDTPESDGRIHFRVFLVPGHPMPHTKYAPSFDQKPYNLRTNGQDVCLRITSPGYPGEALTTNTVLISARTLADAARAEPSPNQARGATRR